MSHSDNIADQSDKAVAQFQDWAMASHLRRQIFESSLPINWSGVCDDCDEYINPDRLAANPRVIRCIVCQSEHERREGRR